MLSAMNNNMICKSDGCKAEAVVKAVERRASRAPGPGPTPTLPPYAANTTRVASKFCIKHTCDFFFKDEGCSYKKPHYDSVCAIHARCPITGCGECKGQYVDPRSDQNSGIKYLRHPFCAEHRCSSPQCPASRIQAHAGGPFLPFCAQHRCAFDGCVKRRVDQRNFCPNHKCAIKECQTVVEENHDICSRHVCCGVRGCSKARHTLPRSKEMKDPKTYGIEEYLNASKNQKTQYLPYCLEHATCETEGCKGFGTPSSQHCPEHTCPERDCKSSSKGNQYCDAHRCESEHCQNPRAWKKNLKDREKQCPLHRCRKQGCLGGVQDMHFFCGIHECSKSGCVFESLAEKLCLVDLKTHYQDDGRTMEKAEVDDRLKSRLSGRGDMGASQLSDTYNTQTPAAFHNDTGPLHVGEGLAGMEHLPVRR